MYLHNYHATLRKLWSYKCCCSNAAEVNVKCMVTPIKNAFAFVGIIECKSPTIVLHRQHEYCLKGK